MPSLSTKKRSVILPFTDKCIYNKNRLDYCNSLLYGVRDHHMQKLRLVMNAIALLIFFAPNNNNDNYNNNNNSNINNNSNSNKGLLNACFLTRVKHMFT